ncbi:flavin reductase [Neptuniibacter halophilus]|uniref:flavin reductase n=1 Tax=Neptuniibacter halophilus TaxID=651666 RepID=UPI0025732AA5|nr:flavin reductase [Neptuniibacter halophilus]
MTMRNLDVRDFRRALAQFPTGVTVITTLDGDSQPVGVTASSFNSVSIDPPLILWSIDKGAYSLETFRTAEFFAVNVLGRDQVDISNRFASRGEDKFKGVEYSAGAGGSPVLQDYAAQFECKTWAVYEGGDHLILVGEVLDYRYQDIQHPLVFARGSYAVSASHPSMVKLANGEHSSEFIGDYLLYLLRETYSRHSDGFYKILQHECGVSPEQWRVLAVLADNSGMQVAELSPLVMQPEVALEETLSWLLDQGVVQRLEAGQVGLTEEGKLLAERLVNMAKIHEANLLRALPDDQAELLKNSLRSLLQANG